MLENHSKIIWKRYLGKCYIENAFQNHVISMIFSMKSVNSGYFSWHCMCIEIENAWAEKIEKRQAALDDVNFS